MSEVLCFWHLLVRMLTVLSQLEIERVSERTKFREDILIKESVSPINIINVSI